MGVPLSQPVPNTDPAPANPTPQPPANPPPASTPPAPAPAGSHGFPESTPVAEMTHEQAANYWKFHSRKHEDSVRDLRSQFSDYDQLKTKAAEADRLRQQVETDSEKAIREAREQARTEALAEATPRLVAAEFRAASAGRIDAERLATLTEDIDLTRYLKQDGTVDLAKVAAKVEAWAPVAQQLVDPAPARGVKPDPTQGSRGGTKTTGMDVGRDMFEARRGKRQPA